MVATEGTEHALDAPTSAAAARPAGSSADAAEPAAASVTEAAAPAIAVQPPQSDADAAAEQAQSEQKAGHKRKVALFMAYIGEGYVVRGMRGSLAPRGFAGGQEGILAVGGCCYRPQLLIPTVSCRTGVPAEPRHEDARRRLPCGNLQGGRHFRRQR